MRNKIFLGLKKTSEEKTVSNQLGDIERDRLIEHGKKIGIDKILKQNERQCLKISKSKYKTEV